MLRKIQEFFKENYKFLIVFLLIIAIFQIELPYKIYAPGGMVSLKDRINVDNGYETSGEFGMAYVSMVRGSLPYLALSYFIPDWDIVSEKKLTEENESFEDMLKADKILTQQSIDSAIISSYKLAGKEVEVKGEVVHVTYIDKDAKTNLKLFDVVLGMDGKEIKDTDELKEIVTSHKEGDKVEINVLRDGENHTCEAEIYLMDGVPKVGIAMTITYDYEERPTASIKMKSSESGPSGGLMMSLQLYNSLVKEDITKGKKIIGTGTIDIHGNVGEIGGVRYKLIGAVKKKADVFLVPAGNYEEAVEVKNEKGFEIRLIPVATLSEAIEALKKL